MRTRFGACVARARLAAALGSPIPTKQVMPPVRARAAQAVIISSAVYAAGSAASAGAMAAGPVPFMPSSSLAGLGARQAARAHPRHVRVQPAQESFPVPADLVPRQVEGSEEHTSELQS